jgi:nucleoside-diphosphate-sugar epimerase
VRALVTGATGFVGSHLAEHLRARGDEVTALIRNPARAGLLNELGIRLERGDLHDLSALDRAVAGQDVIFHVAGAVAAKDEAAYLYGNRDGTANIVRAAERRGAPRFVLVSSMAAGGPAAPGRPRRGDEPSRPVTAYGRSKLAGEAVVRASALPWVIMRPPTVYGPRDRDNFIKVFRIARTGIAPVFGDGSMELSAVYATDLARALAAVAEGSGPVGHIYYPTHPEILTSRGVVVAIARAMGRRVRVIGLPESLARGILTVTGGAARVLGRTTILNADKANEFFQPAWTGDPVPLTAATGWRADHDMESGLALTYAWYRSAGWL